MSDPGGHDTPRVTVVIPTYNWAPVLPYSIGSVLAQTLADLELLVVGDGCTDESEAVVTAIDDPRVRWINLPRNTGHQSGPNNEGFRHARGDVVAYLGHDDLWLPHHLESLVPAIDAGAPAAHTSALFVLPDRAPIVSPRGDWTYERGGWLPPTSFAVARRVLADTGGWRTPAETGIMDPESDLLARVHDAAGPPTWVPRLTCIKLPAMKRRDVYRTRPHHEQAAWWETVRRADDPEAALLAAGGVAVGVALGDPVPQPPWPGRAWRSLRDLPVRLARRVRPTTAAERIARVRRYKGL